MNIKEGFLIFLFSLAAYALPARPITYSISPVWNANAQMMALRVELTFTGDADGATDLQLPFQFAGTFHLNRCISRVRCLGAQSLLVRSDSLVATAFHTPGANLKLIYEVQQAGKHGFTADAAVPFLPLVSENAFHAIGAALFIVPESTDGYSVAINWVDFPPDWALQNSYGRGGGQQSWESPDLRWLSTVFAGGTGWATYSVTIHGHPLDVVIGGKDWAFSDTSLVALLEQIMVCQENFWNDQDRPGFLVVLMPLQNRGATVTAFTGAALERSLAVFADPAQVHSSDDLQHFFHHELTHHWIGGKIRNGGPPNDMTYAWFSEGFTEYFALLNQLQCGFIDSTDYQHIVNQDFLQALEQSPVAKATNAQIAKGFFTDPDLRRLPYLRGFLLARELDGLIEKKSKGKRHLREVMVAFSQGDHTLSANLDTLLAQLSAASGRNVEVMYERFILKGE